jgi:hypothetical protein
MRYPSGIKKTFQAVLATDHVMSNTPRILSGGMFKDEEYRNLRCHIGGSGKGNSPGFNSSLYQLGK